MHVRDNASLLLVAHGSSHSTAAARDLARLADKLRDRGLFARVDVAFWRQEPLLTREQLHGPLVFVLPYFAGLGKHTEQLIPDRLGLTGSITRRQGQTIVYCAPVGCHPDLPALIDRRLGDFCRNEALTAAQTALLVIGHGSRDGGASRTPEAVAAALRDRRHFAEVATAYLEQAPLVKDWPQLVSAPLVIAQPLLLTAGMHASADLPPLFGMNSASDSPARIAGRQVWLRQGIGDDDDIITLMLDQVAQAGADLAA